MMSLKTESPKDAKPPPSSFPPTMDDPRTFPSLPPMSELLRHDHGAHEAQSLPYLARQFQAPFNMVKQPLWSSTVESNTPAQGACHPPQHMNSHFLQGPSDSVLNAPQSQQHTLAVPAYRSTAPQRRIEKRISQRKESSKDQNQSRRGSAELPVRFHEPARRGPFVEAKPPYIRRDSASTDCSLPQMSPPRQSSRSMPISGLLSDSPRYEHVLDSVQTSTILIMSGFSSVRNQNTF
jgi:hypothetical protein